MKKLFLVTLIGASVIACEGPIKKPAKVTESAEEKEKNQKARRINSFLEAVRKPALTFEEVEENNKNLTVSHSKSAVILTFDDYQDEETAWQMSLEEARRTIYNTLCDLANHDEFLAQFAAVDAKGKDHKLDETEKTLVAKVFFSQFTKGSELRKAKKADKKVIQQQKNYSLNSEQLEKFNKDIDAAKERWQKYKQIRRNRALYVAALLMGDKELINASLTSLDKKPLWADQIPMVPLTVAGSLNDKRNDPTTELMQLGMACAHQ